MFHTLLTAFCFGILAPVQAINFVRQIYQFPNTTFHDIENIAIRPNGQLLLNTITEPVTYILDPSASDPTAMVLHRFDHATGVAGIAQVTPDVFAVVVGNYSVEAFKGIPGSFSIWLINLKPATPVVTKVTSIPEAQTLNGMTAISSNVVLVADSALGAIYTVHINAGAYQKTIQDSHFLPSAQLPLGINGIHSKGGTLYFTNSAKATYGKLPITAQGTAAGAVSIIANAPTGNFYDDFALDEKGNAFITTHPSSIEEVISSGIQFTRENSTRLIQPTACVLGNTVNTKCILYVVTAGQVTGNQIVSGQVLAVATC